MKTILFCLFFICSLGAISQAGKIKISEAKLKTAKSIKDIIPELKDCEITSYLTVFSLKSSVKEFDVKNEFFTPEVKSVSGSLIKGEKFFFEKIKCNCRNVRSSYTILIE